MSAPGRRGSLEEGEWPGAGPAAVLKDTVSGNQLIPNQVPGTTASGPGVCILTRIFSKVEHRVLTLGIQAGNAQAATAFPTAVFNGPVFASTSAGLVDAVGAPVGLGAGHPYLACALEYGVGSASQKCWVDWYQGSYNLPPCEFVRVSALPWGAWWALFGLNIFNAVASVGTGVLQGAHVPTVTAVGAFAAGVPRAFPTPANARAVEVLCVDPTVNTTIAVSGAASATRNLSTGLVVPGWTPVELDLGVSAVTITSSAAATLRIQFYLQL